MKRSAIGISLLVIVVRIHAKEPEANRVAEDVASTLVDKLLASRRKRKSFLLHADFDTTAIGKFGLPRRRFGFDQEDHQKPAASEGDITADLVQQANRMKSIHLRTLLQNQTRNDAMFIESGKAPHSIILDYSREKVDGETMDKLFLLAEAAGVEEKKQRMFGGELVNKIEGRAAMHMALRAPRKYEFKVDGKNIVPEVWRVLDSIKSFSNKIRSGEFKGFTGKPLKDVIAIGIGGSYLGVEFVFEALRTDAIAAAAAKGRRLRFLANVDPVDAERALEGLSAETTLVLVVSKTFTTAETMLNAHIVREWIVRELGSEKAVAYHMAACSTSLNKTAAFGINRDYVFGFWDWVGGRFSVSSAVGMLPLSLQYGFDVIETFLKGAHDMDMHFLQAPPQQNLPLIMGLIAVWNLSFMGYISVAILPYSQALTRFVAHIQQLDMESSGKRVQMNGSAVLEGHTGGIIFGEPGTNGQHSFYQLLHQGRIVPSEFIGFRVSQHDSKPAGGTVSAHDELMANYFAQPDALALGRTKEELEASGCKSDLVPHKVFPGDRPSLSMLLPRCDAYWIGQLLALYEHRVAVQGWIWNINSFDQWGVELGKQLAKDVRTYFESARSPNSHSEDQSGANFIGPTASLLRSYLGSSYA